MDTHPETRTGFIQHWRQMLGLFSQDTWVFIGLNTSFRPAEYFQVGGQRLGATSCPLSQPSIDRSLNLWSELTTIKCLLSGCIWSDWPSPSFSCSLKLKWPGNKKKIQWGGRNKQTNKTFFLSQIASVPCDSSSGFSLLEFKHVVVSARRCGLLQPSQFPSSKPHGKGKRHIPS